MKRDLIEEFYASSDEVLFADGFDEAIIGFEPNLWKVVYSRSICIDVLMSTGLDFIDAVEYLEFNTFGAMVGELTPLFIDDLEY